MSIVLPLQVLMATFSVTSVLVVTPFSLKQEESRILKKLQVMLLDLLF